MYGLEAISAHNGWAMAITGPLIVMSGLTILALIISQLHKLVAIFDKKPEPPAATPAESKVKPKVEISVHNLLPDEISETAKIYQPIVDTLEQPFELRELYKAAEQNSFPHPILTANRLREAGILVPEGDGLFIWKG